VNIQFDSAARLAHLARVAEVKAAEARDLQTRRNAVAQLIGQKRREQAIFAPHEMNRDAKRFDELKAEIAALEGERDDLDETFRIASAGSTDALRLHEACDFFAAQNGLPRPSIFSSRSHGGVIA
jgi:hypothetical protein